MENRRFAVFAGLGCLGVVVLAAVVVGALLFGLIPFSVSRLSQQGEAESTVSVSEVTREVAEAVPTLTPVPVSPEETGTPSGPELSEIAPGSLTRLYEQMNPGVVNVRVYVDQGGMTGQGAGSGFVIDEEGHIVTNDHVVGQADVVTVIFYDGTEARAEIVGTDPDSDLAVVRVDEMPDGVRPLELAESDTVQPGDWVIAIGNPFSLGGSVTLGIVSAVGRTIPTAETPFSIPQAIQTDAAINPGNSGGPLLNLDGRVVGVNAQIRSSTGTNSGVGFAIPSNVVRRVAPALIERGSYVWPWLGVQGGAVNLLIREANDLDTQDGAYIAAVVDNGPADQAGLQGATAQRTILGQAVPVGGDVIVEADGQPIEDFTDLLAYVAFKRPGDRVALTVLRDGSREQVTVELAARPEELTP
ncbi:MAG: trypsin-like peptidase domain-containing protein [Anaerolineae bacterium]|nr:trypsin-like peptidase domain-containing protein [Anaerolineae bacterium]